MTKILIGIAAVSSTLALAISLSANATEAQLAGSIEQDYRPDTNRLQLLDVNPRIVEPEAFNIKRFPLMLPQPTKIEQPSRYALV